MCAQYWAHTSFTYIKGYSKTKISVISTVHLSNWVYIVIFVLCGFFLDVFTK